jgi:hypothetical protein
MTNLTAEQRSIVVGEEIYYTGGGHIPVTNLVKFYTEFGKLNRHRGRGMDPRLPIQRFDINNDSY